MTGIVGGAGSRSGIIGETELEYETDDMRGVFEVYRTTQHPEKYEDFGEADLMAELDNRVQTVFTDCFSAVI